VASQETSFRATLHKTESCALFAIGKLVQERIASGNSLIMHFLGQLVLALAIVAAANIIAYSWHRRHKLRPVLFIRPLDWSYHEIGV
jgi:hypothetical protein